MAVRVPWEQSTTNMGPEDCRLSLGGLLTARNLLAPRGGVAPANTASGTPFALTGTGSLTATVGIGQAWIAGTSGATQGPYPLINDSAVTLTFASGSPLARTDLVVAQILDNTYDASGQQKGQIVVVQGTSGGGVPATPANAIPLWQVPVGAGASTINFASSTDVRTYTVALGGVIPATSSQVGINYQGQVRARTDVSPTTVPGALEVADASGTWQPVVPNAYPRGLVGSGTTGTPGPASNSGIYVKVPGVDTTITMSTSRRYRCFASGAWYTDTNGCGLTLSLSYIAGSSAPGNAGGTTSATDRFGGGAGTVAQTNYQWVMGTDLNGPGNGTYTWTVYYARNFGSGNVFSVGDFVYLYIDDVGAAH